MNFKAYKVIQCIGHLHAAIKCLRDLGDENPYPVSYEKLLRVVDTMECNGDFVDQDLVPMDGRVEY